MSASAATLDIEKFRKIYAHVERGVNDGEISNAKRLCEAMAKKAGLTLKQAIKSAKKEAPKPRSNSTAEDIYRYWADRTRAEAEAKAKEQEDRLRAYWAEEERKREARFQEAVAKYGPAEPVFAETPEEFRLRTFLEPFATYSKYANVDELYIDGYIGWGKKYPNQSAFRKVLNEAIPLPETLPDLISEWNRWEDLKERRYAYYSDYDAPRFIYARTDVLEDLIRITPVRNWSDMDARLKWKGGELSRDRWRSKEDDIEEFERLKADLEFLRTQNGQRPEESVTAQNAQNGRRTNADKAADVKSLLHTNPELSDREISRRVGVSPQTVSNWRARLAQSEMFPTEQGSPE